MVFTLSKEKGSISATVLYDGQLEKYECGYAVCDNPVCTCGNLTMSLIPPESSGSSEQQSLRHTVKIDVAARTLGYKNISKVPKEDLKYANMLFSQLDEADFEMLYQLHYILKSDSTEKAPSHSIKATFDYDEIEDEGLTCAYNDILPYGIQLPVMLDEKEYLLLDNYCLRSTCPCTDANIVLLGNINAKAKEMGVILVDYKKKEWEIIERLSVPVTMGALKSAIVNEYPNIYRLLKKRHTRMREIYSHCKRANYSRKEEDQIPKVGRNEPCPCGSGKKFKRCCGRG